METRSTTSSNICLVRHLKTHSTHGSPPQHQGEGGGLLLDYKWGALMMDACQAVQLLIGNQQGLRSPFAGHRPRLGPLCLRHSHPWRFPPRRWTAHCSMVASGEGWKVMSLGAHRRGERQTHPPQLSSSSTPSAQRGHLDFLGTEKP
jgi:hypothetical protein